MKVTQLMVNKGFGGAERYFVDLSLALQDAGHTVQAICHKDFQQRSMLQGHPRIEVAPIRVLGWWDPLAVKAIRLLTGRFQPDVIQAHLARGARLAGKAARALGIPLIVKTHNYVDLKYYKDVSVFVPTTEDQRDYLLQQGVPPARVCVIPNFSSLAPAEQPRPLSPGVLTYVSYGRIVAKKGFDLLLRAFRELLKAGVNARLIIAGDGPEREALTLLAQRLQLGDAVRVCGWSNDVASLLASGDIFVLPSRDEPFGIAVLEAMASQIPVVATRTRGPLEVLNDELAFLAEVDDVTSLTKAMMQAASDPTLRRRKAALALQRYQARYSREAVVPQIIDLYKRVIGANLSNSTR